MALSVERRTVVVGGDLKEPLVLKDIKVTNGCEFFRARKGDPALSRLLTGSSWRNERPMKHSGVFARVTELRNQAVDKLLYPPR